MKYLYTLLMSVCLTFSLAACKKTEDTDYEPEPPEGIYPETADAQPAAQEPFSAQEIRDYCKYVTGNAANFYNLYMLPFVRGEGPKPSAEELFSKLEDMYQFDTALEISDEDRELMGSSLWVVRTFVERSEGVQTLLNEKRRLPTNFTEANQQWCQKSMRGDQPPFEFLGSVVPYTEFQRN